MMAVSLEAVHTHTHTHNICLNNITININEIRKISIT